MSDQENQPGYANAPASESEEGTPNTIVIRVRWIYVLGGLMVLAGTVAALAAGLWLGRSRSSAGKTAQVFAPATGQFQAAQPPSVPGVQPQVVPLRPQAIPQAGSSQVLPRSSAGVTTSLGRTPSVGDPAPDFTLKNLEGEEVSLSDFRGQPVLINFWATWCPPCRFEMPAIEAAWQKHKDDGFVVLAVNVEEPISTVQRFVDSLGLTFPILLDYKSEVANGPYRLRAFPTSYFVGRDGNIVVAHRGMMTGQILEQYMERVMATGQKSE